MVTLETAGFAHAGPPASRPNDFVRNLHASDPAPQSNSFPQGTVILLNGRTLAGPNGPAQQRGGRLFLPIATLAPAHGDSVDSYQKSPLVTVLRHAGRDAEFRA